MTYPLSPGWSRPGTSQVAAMQMTGRAFTLREGVLLILDLVPSTADECAEFMGRTVLSIRPRLTELEHMGHIRDTGRRRKNISGRYAIVWEVA